MIDSNDIIIEQWENELTPKDFPDFESFDTYQKDHSRFSRCCKNNKNVSLFFHCENCCIVPDGVYCISCFNKSEHINHDVSVVYNGCSFCDCGDPKTIKKECWCSDHGSTPENENFPYEKSFFRSKISEIYQKLIDNLSNDLFSEIIDFLYNITEWGSLYTNTIAEILFEGTWETSFYGQIIRNHNRYISEDIENLRNFLFKIVVSPYFKRGYTKFLVETIKVLSMVYQIDFHENFIKIADFTFQCFHEGPLLIEFQESDSVFTNVIDVFIDIYTHSPFLLKGKYVIPTETNFELHSLFSQIIHLLFYNPLFLKYIVKQPKFLESLTKVISINSQNAILFRKRGEKVNFNTNIHIIQLNNNLNIYHIWRVFSLMLPTITINFDYDVNNGEVYDLPVGLIDDSHITTLNSIFSIFSKELDKFLEINETSNSFGSSSYYIQPYVDEFVIDNQLAKAFISLAMCFSIFNQTDPLSIFLRIEFSKFDQLAAIFISCEAGKSQILNDLFVKNDDSIVFLATYYDLPYLSTISEIQSLISLKEKTKEGSSSDIVIMIAESFGITLWETISPNDLVDCQKWTNVITSMLRLLIQLSCNDNFFDFRLSQENMKRTIIDLIYCGENNMLKMKDKFQYFSYDFPSYLLEDVADIKIDDQGSHFILKPEYDGTSSVFSPVFKLNEFNKMLSYEISNNKGRLLRLNPIDPPISFFGLKSYLHTKELRTLIKRVLIVLNSCNEKFSVSCAHTTFSLVRLVLMESKNPEKTEEKYIKSGIIQLLIKTVKKLENGDLYLKNFVTECQPKYLKIAEIVENEIKENTELKNKKKVDKSKILKQFMNLQKEFASKNKDELNTIENTSPTSFNCVFCGESFDSSRLYGILVNLYRSFLLSNIESVISDDCVNRYKISCQLRTCGHWCHCECYNAENHGYVGIWRSEIGIHCPFDRTFSNAIIPVFQGDEPTESFKEEIKNLFEKVQSLCYSSAPQCLAYNISLTEILNRHNPKYIDDKRTILCLIHFLRACLYNDSIQNDDDDEEEESDIFVKFTIDFCSNKNLKEAKEKFNLKLVDFWHQLVINSFVEQDEKKQLSLIETYVRRVSLLEQIAFSSDSDSIFLPSVSEFIESHQLKTIKDEFESHSFGMTSSTCLLSPCEKFEFPNLQKNFIDYILKYDIIMNNKNPNIEFCVCLMCGKLCQKNEFYDTEFVNIKNHAFNCCGNTSTVILLITGKMASSVLFYDGVLNAFLDCGSVYTDKYGDENIGLKQGTILVLNQSRVSKLFEDLITGELRRKLELEMKNRSLFL